MKIDTKHIMLTLKSKYFNSTCRVRAFYLAGSPYHYMITQSQYKRAKRLLEHGDGDAVVWVNNSEETRLYIIGGGEIYSY